MNFQRINELSDEELIKLYDNNISDIEFENIKKAYCCCNNGFCWFLSIYECTTLWDGNYPNKDLASCQRACARANGAYSAFKDECRCSRYNTTTSYYLCTR